MLFATFSQEITIVSIVAKFLRSLYTFNFKMINIQQTEWTNISEA